MKNNLNTQSLYRLFSFLIIILVISYLLPIAGQIFNVDYSLIHTNIENRNEAWSRSLIFATVSSLFNVLVSLWLAIQLREIPLFSKKGFLLSILIVPVLIGDVSIAFIGKVLLADVSAIHENITYKFTSLILMQFWQFGTLFTYLFWLMIQNIQNAKKNFARTSRLTPFEYVKDIILPACRNLLILSFILNFVFAFFENAKSQFIFKASRGTNSEFICKWLERYYQSNSLFNLEFAVNNTLKTSMLVMLTALFTIALLSLLINFLYKKTITGRYNLPSIHTKFISNIIFYLLLLLILLPIIYIIVELVFNATFSSNNLLYTIGLTSLSAILATFLSIQLGVLLRLGWKEAMSSFGVKSLMFFSILLLILLFPPLSLLITGFKWLSIIGYNNSILINIVWIFGHILLVLPILSCFVAVTHYRTKNNEINFLESYKLNYKEISTPLFYRRYIVDYCLTFLVAFSMIWNESTINNLLSDFIPSFISEMKMSISGRGTNYSSGISYFLISITLAFISLLLWNGVLKRIKNKLE